MKGYKAFDKDMKCRDFQFKEGETYTIDGAISLCSRGFHFCLNPLDILSYYPLVGSLFCEVSADGVSNQKESDSKRVASKITIGARLSIKTMAKAAVNFISDSVNPKDSNAATAGYAANAATAGEAANAAAMGPNSIASAIGINSAARGAIGNWIVVAEWLQNKTDYSWAVKSVKTTKVDGKRIKADTFYKLVGGKFVEAE